MTDSLHHVLNEDTGQIACGQRPGPLAGVYEEIEFAKLARSGMRVCDSCIAFLTGKAGKRSPQRA